MPWLANWLVVNDEFAHFKTFTNKKRPLTVAALKPHPKEPPADSSPQSQSLSFASASRWIAS